ncbi:helix-turn-helix domain-containing protein [Chitinophaga niabensis]|uniref:helix-turn-helix domain-containing protein n=1 Tax=Chitinophaga niabensis TaxID=536979 RepID=UPI003D2EF28C
MIPTYQHHNCITDYMKLLNVKANDLAKHMKMTKSQMHKWMSNTYQPRIDQLYNIADCLKIHPTRLISAYTSEPSIFNTVTYVSANR